ncbi:MAG: hypothetical protein P8P99_00535 [Maricaulis sp.]|nr:hypothetical protein [Maricaulis sp.]
MTDKLEFGTNEAINAQIIESDAAKRGVVGKWFGDKEHAPVNIAGFAFFFLLAALLAALFIMPGTATVSTISGIMGTTLGYIFGKK